MLSENFLGAIDGPRPAGEIYEIHSKQRPCHIVMVELH